MFEIGPGPVTWIYISEIMNEKGVAVATFLIWLGTLLCSLSTPASIELLKGYTFVVYAAMVFLGFLFVVKYMKETKGLSENEVLQLYRSDCKRLQDIDEPNASRESEVSRMTPIPDSSFSADLLDDRSSSPSS